MKGTHYTKHYYAEAERITSQLGKGQFVDVGTPVVSDSLVQVKLQAVTGNVEYPATLTVPGSGAFAYLDTLTNQQNATSTLYFYHPDHLGSSSWITTTNGTVKQHLHYLPWGEDFVNQRSSHFDGVRYTFSAKEKDTETGYSYFGARYYSSDLSIWLSVDPQAAKYPGLSPYTYCANNPVKCVDPNGEEFGDYYSIFGKWLGSDGIDDDKAYIATGKNSKGAFLNAKELPISNTELLDRATWVCGESGGSNEQITSRTQNAGDAISIGDASVADYYAFAIQNAAKADGGFYKAVKNRMGKMINGMYTKTSPGYFEGQGLGGNSNSKAFANARASGMESINSDSRFTNSIAAVIKSVTSSVDPTGGCRAWLGSSSAKKYVDGPQNVYSNNGKTAVMQFSFSSSNKKFNHTFYHF